MENCFRQPDMEGRAEQLSILKERFDKACQGQGSTVLIAGEAGLGKTRLVLELLDHVKAKDFRLINGSCLSENLEPLMPFREALRKAGLYDLISEQPPPRVIATYLIRSDGVLVFKSERQESKLDGDIFAGMLKMVGDFVRDSLSMMGKEDRGLNVIGYGRYTILIETLGNASLACVIEGVQNEFLVNDMRRTLKEIEGRLDGWKGHMSKIGDLEQKVSWFISSNKYDGEFLVDNPKLKQENLFDNILMGIHRATTEQPLILFLDDIQWADPTTLNLMHYLARNTRDYRFLIIGTYRPEDIIDSPDGRPHHLELTIQNMNRENILKKIKLTRLGPDDISKIISSFLGKTNFERELLDVVCKETDGNPFFILELIKLLVEEGHINKIDDKWILDTNIDKINMPSKIYDVIKRRLNRLREDQREILECASVEGEEFRSEILCRVLKIDRLKLLKNLNKMENKHNIIHSMQKKYRFDHRKIMEALYMGLSDELKQEYHRQIGDSITDLYGDDYGEMINELAHHYYQAKDPRAVKYLIKTGDDAKSRFANSEASLSYHRALDMLDDPGDSVNILEKLGEVQRLMGEYDKAIQNFEEALEETDDLKIKARNRRKIAETYLKKGDFDMSLKILDETKRLVKSEHISEEGRRMVVEGEAHLEKGDFNKAMPLFSEAVKRFKKFGAEKDMGKALRAVGSIHLRKGDYDRALENYRKSLTAMENVGDKRGISAVLNNIGLVYWYLDEHDLVLEYYNRGLDLDEMIGNIWGVAISLNNIGNVHFYKGELEMALDYYQRCLEINQKIGDKKGISHSLNNLGLVFFHKGEIDKSLELFKEGLKTCEKIEYKPGTADSLLNIGGIYHHMGELDKALEIYKRGLEICDSIGDKWLAIHSHLRLSELHLKLDHLEIAFDEANKGSEIALDIGTKQETAMAYRVLGMVHRERKEWNKAKDSFSKGKKITKEIEDKKELARILYEYAYMFNKKGELKRSINYFKRAKLIFEECGSKLWLDKCIDAINLLEDNCLS